MKIFSIEKFAQRKKAECLILPFFHEHKKATPAFSCKNLAPLFSEPVKLQDFSGKKEELAFLYVKNQKEARILLMGLGKSSELTAESLRSIVANAALALGHKKIKTVNFHLPDFSKLAFKDFLRSICEGLLLSNYSFDKLKHEEKKASLLETVFLIGASGQELSFLKHDYVIAQSVHLARDLVNDNADTITPQKLAETAQSLEKLSSKIKVTVLDKSKIKKEKMGLLLAVGQGASVDPTFIIIEYLGAKKTTDHTILVGKGITYDTGGLSLKPTTSMETMRSDMAGAAAVIGTMRALALLDLPIHVTGLIPATENAIGSRSYKPGDVYQGYSGKTVEVMNTDAEGRLVLADALSYGVKRLKPTRIIDIATLTGAVSIALGEEIAGLFSNEDSLAEQMLKASKRTGEHLWRLPLYEAYLEQLKSDIADLKNIGNGKGGSIMGALFLKEFVEKTPWAHLDIGSSSWMAKPKGYYTSHATGVGVRLFIEFLEDLIKEK
jgi:leucyl aminopeptidase